MSALKIYASVKSGDVAAVRRLLDESPPLLHAYLLGRSWLHHAAARGNLEMVQMLVDAGLNVNVAAETRPDGPLIYAVSEGDLPISRWLLDQGANPNVGRVLQAAVVAGSQELVELLLERGADLHACYEESAQPPSNALTHAIKFQRPRIEQLLRERGAVEPIG